MERKKVVYFIAMVFLVFMVCGDGAKSWSAEGGEEKEYILKEMVVTATRTEKSLEKVPASVSVVTNKEMERRNLKSLDEALNVLPGVYNPRLIPGGLLDSLANAGVTMRGIPRAAKNLVMIDGMVINDSYSGSQRSMLSLAPENVERIEVVRGPFSALYGGYAMGGVVNIITRMPEKREVIFKTGYGSAWERSEAPDDVYRVYGSYGDAVLGGNLTFLVSYGYEGTNGYPMDEAFSSRMPPSDLQGWSKTNDPQGRERYLIGDTGDETWWDDKAQAKLKYRLSDSSSIVLSYTRFRYKYEFDDPHTYLRDPAGNPVIWPNEATYLMLARGPSYNEDNIYGMSYEGKFGDLLAKFVAGFQDRDYWYTSPASGYATFSGESSNPAKAAGTVTETPGKRYNTDLQFTLPLSDRQVLTFGASYLGGQVKTTRYDLTNWKDEDSKGSLRFKAKGKDNTISTYIQDEFMIFPKVTIYPALRLDWWKAYDGFVKVVDSSEYTREYDSTDKVMISPKFALIYELWDKTSLRASIGTAYRPPSIYELYSAAITSQAVIEGNPNLKPEKTLSWDIGLRQKLWKGASAELTYFENYLEDLIYSITIGNAPPPYENRAYKHQENVGKAKSYGIEMALTQELWEGVKVFANYTYTYGTITDAPKYPEIEGKRLVQTPKHLFNVGVDFTHGPFSGSITGRYVSKRYSSDKNDDKESGVWGSYDPYFLLDAKLSYKVTDFCTVSFSINNLLDEDYYAYYKAPGRSWFAEVTFRF